MQRAIRERGVRRSLAVSTILQMGIRITLVVIAATVLSYWHIVGTLEEQTSDKLSKYITERAQKESFIFLQAQENHRILKEVFLQAWPGVRETGYRDFDLYFETLPDGSTRTRPELFYGAWNSDGIITDSIAGFIGRNVPLDDPIFRSRLVLAFHMLDRYGVTYRESFANLYIHMPENVNLVYWPGLPWGLQAEPDLDMRLEEWMYIADRAHNPGRDTIWTGLYYDPTADEWMVSAETPVDVGGQHLITIGHDLLLNKLFDRVFKDRLEGAYNFIIRDDGRLIAHPDKQQELRKALGNLNVADLDDTALASMFERIEAAVSADGTRHIIDDAESDAFLAVSRIEGPDWLFVTVYPKSLLSSTARGAAEFILTLGIASLILELAMLFIVLREKVIRPVNAFVAASESIGRGDYELSKEGRFQLPEDRRDEIGLMARTFTYMTDRVRNYRHDLETQVAERTEQLAVATSEANSANKAKSEFLARMSHEIRTPMNAIIGMTQLALRTEMTAKQRDYLEKVRGSSNALLGIINDILDFSKIEAGKLSLERTRFNIDDVLDNLSDICTLRTEAKNIELVFDIQGDLPRMLIGDPLRLGQILINLVGNAVKFTERGEVLVRGACRRLDEERVELLFSVIDTGIGMTPDQLDGLFHSFAQADESITRKYGGTGLGLAICKQLTELMGGRIWAESEPGVGSRFHFTVTLGVQEVDRAEPDRALPLFGSKRVLIADDNQCVRDVLAAMLTRMGLRVEQVENGQQATERLREACTANDPFDLLLTDWRMPEMDGLELVAWLRQQMQPECLPAILMVTGYGREEVFQQAGEVGLDGFLLKPVNESVMQDTLAELFGGERRGGSAQRHAVPVDSAATARLAGCRILLVEDNAINLQIAREFLADVGAVVELAGNGQQAVDRVMNNRYDLVLMDIQMPIMDGLTATAEIRRQARFDDLPIIAMTAQAMEEDRRRCREVGMNDHLAKPLMQEELYRKLNQWLKPAEANLVESVSAGPGALPAPLPGIDTGQGLANLGGREVLYLKLLADFSREYADLGASMQTWWTEGCWDEIYLHAHSVKSAAAYLGAQALSLAAGRLERAARDRHEECSEMLVVFDEQLVLVLNALRALPSDEFGPQAAPTLSDAELRSRLDSLQSELEADNARAEATLAAIMPSLLACGLGDPAACLQAQVDDVEYEDALRTLRQIREQWDERKAGVMS